MRVLTKVENSQRGNDDVTHIYLSYSLAEEFRAK